jgi:hypothetical protein
MLEGLKRWTDRGYFEFRASVVPKPFGVRRLVAAFGSIGQRELQKIPKR